MSANMSVCRLYYVKGPCIINYWEPFNIIFEIKALYSAYMLLVSTERGDFCLSSSIYYIALCLINRWSVIANLHKLLK
ncbi:uncharacterized protein BX663DRAFT_456177, partial [Cokeromyces recurvatus]|uniref:uncharacterized protein n=1 Tax=Cokeromyces recurvatus TaxID=90255 RepID=UPI00221FACB6